MMRLLLLIALAGLLVHYSLGQCPGGTSLSATELVVNGNFSQGNTGFTSGYQYTTYNTNQQQYDVTTGPGVSQWNGGMWSHGDHTTGSGNLLDVNGATVPGIDFWCQNIPVMPHTVYVFSAWVSIFNTTPPPPTVQLLINGAPVGASYTGPGAMYTWVQFSATWNSGANTSISLCLIDSSISAAGNDFGIDDISFRPCSCNSVVNPGTITATPDTICSGNSSQLSVSGNTGTIQWQSSGDGISFTNLPGDTLPVYNALSVSQTTYYRVESTGSCSTDSSKSIVVKVIPIPEMGIVSVQPDTICKGSVAYLTTDSMLANAFQWQSSFNGGNFTVIDSANSSGFITPPLSQTTYYRVVLSNSMCSDTSVSVAVNVVPFPQIGILFAQPDTICQGSITYLATDSLLTGHIQWQYSITDIDFTNLDSANGFGFYTAPLAQTTYYRLVLNNEFCFDTSTSFSVVVNPPPPTPTLMASDSIICASDSALIQSSGPYAFYLWNNGDSTSSVYVNSAGDYWLTVTDANGCTAVSAHKEISVYPVPSVSIIVQGDTLSSFNAQSYQWLINDSIIKGATSPVYVARRTGYYAVQVTDSNGCITISNSVYVSVAGIEEQALNLDLKLYPNPATDAIYIATDANILFNRFVITDATGREITRGIIASKQQLIPLNNFSGGVYLITLATSEGASLTKKLVVGK